MTSRTSLKSATVVRSVAGAATAAALLTLPNASSALFNPCDYSCHAYIILCCPKPCLTTDSKHTGATMATADHADATSDSLQQQQALANQVAMTMGAAGKRAALGVPDSVLTCAPRQPGSGLLETALRRPARPGTEEGAANRQRLLGIATLETADRAIAVGVGATDQIQARLDRVRMNGSAPQDLREFARFLAELRAIQADARAIANLSRATSQMLDSFGEAVRANDARHEPDDAGVQ